MGSLTDLLDRVESWVVSRVPGVGKPWFSPVHHALVTVVGLKPYRPVGPFAIAVYLFAGTPWLWLVASTWAWIWYLDRELDQHGGRIPWRLDPVLDVLVPFLALVALWWLLLL